MINLEQWASNHETSIEIVQLIVQLFGPRNLESIWGEATEDQIAAVLMLAWKETEEDELFWGVSTFMRPTERRIK